MPACSHSAISPCHSIIRRGEIVAKVFSPVSCPLKSHPSKDRKEKRRLSAHIAIIGGRLRMIHSLNVHTRQRFSAPGPVNTLTASAPMRAFITGLLKLWFATRNWVPEPSHVGRENAILKKHYYGLCQFYSLPTNYSGDYMIIFLPPAGDLFKNKCVIIQLKSRTRSIR